MWLEDNKDIDLTRTFSAFCFCFETVWILPSPLFSSKQFEPSLAVGIWFCSSRQVTETISFSGQESKLKEILKKKEKSHAEDGYCSRIESSMWTDLNGTGLCVFGVKRPALFACASSSTSWFHQLSCWWQKSSRPPFLQQVGVWVSLMSVGVKDTDLFGCSFLSSSAFCEAVIDSLNMIPHLSKLAFE